MAGSPYRPPWWLPGRHLQTIYPALFLRRPRVAYRRERWDTPDGDFIDLDWLMARPRPTLGNPAGADTRREPPLVVLFHGLEGSSRGHYALCLMGALERAGWRGVVPHFRGCSGEANRLARAYHSGDSAEIGWILRRLRERAGEAPLYAVGVSLGGNALLKWLGEQAEAAAEILRAAAAVSAPLDLTAAGEALARGFNRLYTAHFLRTLKAKSLNKLERFPRLYDADAVRRAATFREFDDLVTAPLHGFRDAADYWARSSSKPLLSAIRVPTLLVNAKNDPFLPASALPAPSEVSSWVVLDLQEQGGHAGFASGPFPGRLEWLPRRILGFFAAQSHRSNLPPSG